MFTCHQLTFSPNNQCCTVISTFIQREVSVEKGNLILNGNGRTPTSENIFRISAPTTESTVIFSCRQQQTEGLVFFCRLLPLCAAFVMGLTRNLCARPVEHVSSADSPAVRHQFCLLSVGSGGRFLWCWFTCLSPSLQVKAGSQANKVVVA
jgi:hypothetical protein